jgi:hypothetical protein
MKLYLAYLSISGAGIEPEAHPPGCLAEAAAFVTS